MYGKGILKKLELEYNIGEEDEAALVEVSAFTEVIINFFCIYSCYPQLILKLFYDLEQLSVSKKRN